MCGLRSGGTFSWSDTESGAHGWPAAAKPEGYLGGPHGRKEQRVRNGTLGTVLFLRRKCPKEESIPGGLWEGSSAVCTSDGRWPPSLRGMLQGPLSTSPTRSHTWTSDLFYGADV